MVTKTSTIQLVQKNNEVMQLQNYSFRNESFWPSAGSSEQVERLAPRSPGKWVQRVSRENESKISEKLSIVVMQIQRAARWKNSLHVDSNSGKVLLQQMWRVLTVEFGGSEVNKTAKRKNVTQQPMSRWHPGGIASRWPCKGIAVPLRVRSCSE